MPYDHDHAHDHGQDRSELRAMDARVRALTTVLAQKALHRARREGHQVALRDGAA